MSKTTKTQLLLIAGLLILLIAIPLGIYLIRQQQNFKSRAFQPKGTVAFQFSPSIRDSSNPVAINNPLEVTVQIDTGDFNKVTAVDFTINYDDKLRLDDFEINTGSSLNQQVLKNIDTGSRTLHYIAVNTSSSLSSSGLVNIGKLKFTATQNGVGAVSVNQNPVITIAGQDSKVNALLAEGRYAVGTGAFSPSPSATTSGSPAPAACINGAIRGQRCVDNTGFVEWFKEWVGLAPTKNADFYPECRANGTRGDSVIDIADYEVWRRESGGTNKCQ